MKIRLGDLLVESGVITRDQLGQALRHQSKVGGRLGTNLVELGLVDEKTIAATLAKQLSIPSVTQAQLERIGNDVWTLVPGPLAARLRVIPVRLDAGRLWVAMSDPTDQSALDEIARLTKKPARPLVAPERLIQWALEKYYKVAPPSRVSATPSFELEMESPMAAQPVPLSVAYADEVISLDATDMATGYLDDEARPALAGPGETLTLPQLYSRMAAAASDELVLDAVLRFLSTRVARLCVLTLKHGELSAWRGFNIEPHMLGRMRVALADVPLFSRSLDSGQSWAGQLGPMAVGALAAPLGLASEVLGLVVPVRVGRQPMGVLIGLDASLDLLRKKAELDKLAEKIDQALHISYLKRLLLAP